MPKEVTDSKLKNGDKAVKKEKKFVKLDPVRIYDSECLLNIHRDLGEKYRLVTLMGNLHDSLDMF